MDNRNFAMSSFLTKDLYQTFSLAKSLVMRKLETLKNSEKPQRKTIIMISEDTAQAEIPRLFKDALSQLTLILFQRQEPYNFQYLRLWEVRF